MNNHTCFRCGKEFHYCASCDDYGVRYLANGYCSKECLNTVSRTTQDLWKNCRSTAEGSIFKSVYDDDKYIIWNGSSFIGWNIVDQTYCYDVYAVVDDVWLFEYIEQNVAL